VCLLLRRCLMEGKGTVVNTSSILVVVNMRGRVFNCASIGGGGDV